MEANREQSCIVERNSSTMREVKTGDCKKMIATKIELLPWVVKFKAMCITDRSVTALMEYFIKNIQPVTVEFQTKPLSADKLKSFMSESLLFFLYSYKSHEESTDRAVYMEFMSDLLAMYIDMELKASKRSSECHDKISARLSSYLFIYLENSPEYLLNTLLKMRLMSSVYYQILDPLLRNIFKILPQQPDSTNMYIQYFLIYRIWKRISKELNAKSDINERALRSLKSPPTSLPQQVIDHVLPKVPNTEKISARLLLSQRIELEKSCDAFLDFWKSSKRFRADVKPNLSDENVETKLEDNLSCKSGLRAKENSSSNNSLLISDVNDQSQDLLNISTAQLNLSEPLKVLKPPRRVLKKSADIVLIDLTSDDAKGKIMKQKKTNKRLLWMQNIINIKSTNATNNEDLLQPEDAFGLESLMICSQNISSSQLITCEKIWNEVFDINDPETKSQEVNFASDNSQAEVNIKNVSRSSVEALSSLEPDKMEKKVKEEAPVLYYSGIKDDLEVSPAAKMSVDIVSSHQNESTDPNVDSMTSEATDDVNPSIKPIPELKSTNLYSPEHIRSDILQINNYSESYDKETDSFFKLNNVDHHIDGLSLLASVSQTVSHLNTVKNTREMIKVKDYKGLATLENVNYPQDTSNYEKHPLEMNEVITAYSSDKPVDKVTLHVAIPPAENVSTSCNNLFNSEPLNCCYNRANEPASIAVQVESSNPPDKDDANVILNGETIVLLQKSPNSNLYIINKAVENRESINGGEEENSLSDKMKPIINDAEEMYPYEMYDPIYRIVQPVASVAPYDLSQASRRLPKAKSDLPGDSMRALDLKKAKKNSEILSPRRRQVRQDHSNSCQELVDARTLHIPPTSALSGIYHSNYPAGDLYIACRQNCQPVSLACNHSARPHASSCLNCAYDIVTHCSQCIMPSVEDNNTSSINGGYYIPLPQPPVIKDCSLSSAKFSEPLICKIETELSEEKKQIKIFEAENSSRLPLKKRFKMAADFENTPIKREKAESNYPGTPMISIAALESVQSGDLSGKVGHSKDTRQNYEKNVTENSHGYGENRKQSSVGFPAASKPKRAKRIARPSKKVKEPKSPSAARRTRSSQGKIPKINYSYVDMESDWNPSVEAKRKKRKTSR